MKLQLIAGGALVALLAGCGSDPVYYTEPSYVSSSGYYVERPRYVADTRIETIEVLRGSAPVVVAPPPTPDMYRVTVRKPDGSFETYVMQTLGTLKAGDRVRIVNGTIYPLG